MQIVLFKFLCIVLIVTAYKPRERICNYNEQSSFPKCYKKEILASMAHSPNQIVVDRTTNHLYFSFDSGNEEYTPARVKIHDKTIMVLRGIKDAFAMAYHDETNEVYFGGSYGIYKYHHKSQKLKRLALANLDIWWLVVREGIYFIKFPSLNVFKYDNKSVTYMDQLRGHNVHQFVFDGEGNIFFINSTGLYGVDSEENQAFLVTDRPRFLGMASDNNGKVYLCNEDGIYVLAKNISKVNKLVNVPGVLGLTFDKDNNIIYSDSQELVMLSEDKISEVDIEIKLN